uniref:Uncharacterized protein n=1 Tax=Caenorhabditis japonica TaxID=281687 RepID=A0A8R1DNE6_CAEJA
MARATNPPPISPQLTVSTSDSLQFLLFHASPSSVDGAAIKEISENSEPLKTKPKKSAKELKVLPGCEPEVVQEALGKFSTSYNLDTNGHVLLETPSQNQKE